MPHWKDYWTAVHAKDETEAKLALSTLIETALSEYPAQTYEKARQIQLSNIGYFFGYLSTAEVPMAMALYPEAEHPIFGRNLPSGLSTDALIKTGMAVARAAQEDGELTERAIQAGRDIVAANAPKTT